MGQAFTTLLSAASLSIPVKNTQTRVTEAQDKNLPTSEDPSQNWIIIEECSGGEAGATSTKVTEPSFCTRSNPGSNKTTLQSIPLRTSSDSFVDIPQSLVALEYNLTEETSGGDPKDNTRQQSTTKETEAKHISLTEVAFEGAKRTYSGARLVLPPLSPVMEDFVQTIEEGMGIRN